MQNNKGFDLLFSQTNNYVRLSIVPPEGEQRHPCSIICVVDGSLSMGSQIIVQNKQGERKQNQMTTLDLIKHTVKTIANVLTSQDRLSLVGFSTHSKIYYELIEMDDNGKNTAFSEIDKMWAGGQTNIWGGLFDGLEVMRKNFIPNQNVAIFLFTDGRPTMIPATGHLEMLRRWKEQHPHLEFSLHTFGFGYELDTDLMVELAQEQSGMYYFISDHSMIGTVFSNALANIITTMSHKVQLNIQLSEGYAFDGEGVMCSQSYQSKKGNKNTSISLNLGLIRYGQTKDLIFKITSKEGRRLQDVKIDYKITYKFFVGDNPQDFESQEKQNVCVEKNGMIDDDCHYYRLLFIEKIKQSILRMSSGFPDRAIKNINDLITEIQKKIKENDAIVSFLQGLLGDLEGQVSLAFSKQEYFQKWGIHYLPSLYLAHLLQLCSNFKDIGIQNYGSSLFKKEREITDQTFCGNKFKSNYLDDGRNLYAKFYDLVNLNDFYDVSGGCIHGKCKVSTSNNQTKNIEDIRAGDMIVCPALKNKLVKVICVVKTLCKSNKHNFVRLGNLLITPWHPVRINAENNKWSFPSDLGQTIEEEADSVYSFLLEDGHTMNVEGVECITLAHNFTEPVAQHEYYGTELIVNDLKNMRGWSDGYITVDQSSIIRDKKTLKVINMIQI